MTPTRPIPEPTGLRFLRIDPNGMLSVVVPPDRPARAVLGWFHDQLDGTYETVRTCLPGIVLAINEEGSLRDMPPNPTASRLMRPASLHTATSLVGPVLAFRLDAEDLEDSLSDPDLQTIRRIVGAGNPTIRVRLSDPPTVAPTHHSRPRLTLVDPTNRALTAHPGGPEAKLSGRRLPPRGHPGERAPRSSPGLRSSRPDNAEAPQWGSGEVGR